MLVTSLQKKKKKKKKKRKKKSRILSQIGGIELIKEVADTPLENVVFVQESKDSFEFKRVQVVKYTANSYILI